jgi:type II secretory pathway component GspD/PulD (secretin)
MKGNILSMSAQRQNHIKLMKPKLSVLIIIGLLACVTGIAQTNPPAGDTATASEGKSVAEAPADAPVLAQADAPATNAPPTNVPPPDAAAPAAPPAEGVTPPPATPPPAAQPEAVIPGEPAPPQPISPNLLATPGAVIPLIVMDDVPLTDAIKNLARQAGLNYMLDPKIQFGQPDDKGRVTPQPSVSIRWENVTAEQALAALLNNYNLQLVEDPKSKIARVTIRDPAAPPPLVTRIIQLKFASPTNVVPAVQNTFTDKRSKVVPDVRTSQLVVLATENELVAVDQLVERLDLQTKQVLIEARLLETSMSPSTTKGIDWSGTLQAQHLAFGNNLQSKPVSALESENKPLADLWPKLMFDTAKGFNPATAFLDADGVNAVFSFLNKNAEAKVISAPRTVTLDNETAHISVTRAEPIFKNTAGTQGSPGGSEVTYTNLGVILQVTPRISANNYVNLRVIPEVSRVFNTVRKTVSSTINEADEYDIRKIDTRVMIPSGNTLVLGGLVQDDVRNENTKVPILGDMPVLGYAFRSDAKRRQKSNLLIFITPTIVQDEDFQPTKTDFLKTPVAEDSGPEWSAWDSGKPLDWSKPAYQKEAAHYSDIGTK